MNNSINLSLLSLPVYFSASLILVKSFNLSTDSYIVYPSTLHLCIQFILRLLFLFTASCLILLQLLSILICINISLSQHFVLIFIHAHHYTRVIWNVFIFTSLSLFTVVTFAIVGYLRSRRLQGKMSLTETDDDIRENIRRYEDEGGGEDDIRAFDLTSLQIPVDMEGKTFSETLDPSSLFHRKSISPHIPGSSVQVEINSFLDDRLHKFPCQVNDFSCDQCTKYAYEGCGSSAGSLSSLSLTRENIEKDFDYLNTERVHFSTKSTPDLYQLLQQGVTGKVVCDCNDAKQQETQ